MTRILSSLISLLFTLLALAAGVGGYLGLMVICVVPALFFAWLADG